MPKAPSQLKRQQSAYLLAAVASSKQQLDANTNHYLDLLAQETKKSAQSDIASTIVKVKLLLAQEKIEAYQEARTIIDDNHKFIGHDPRLLSLEIDLCIIEERFQSAVDHLVAARKEKKH